MNSGTHKDSIAWLLEPENINIRYLAQRDLVKTPASEFDAIKRQAHTSGAISRILDAMKPEGYWQAPGAGYYPKYSGTVWSIILLSQLGASAKMDERIATACAYFMEHALLKGGQFSTNGLPSGTVDCMHGNMCAAFLDLEFESPGLDRAFEWMARTVIGQGIAAVTEKSAPVRYYAGKCGPNFACGSNNKLSCAWGAVKVMLAFSKLPEEKRTPLIKRAIEAGVDFLFSRDPAKADYPSGYAVKPSGNWWKFGFPVFYVTDMLQNVEALVGLGYADDPRLVKAIDFIRGKQDNQGRWKLEYDYSGKTWVDFGPKNVPNKWVTLRALRVLNSVK